jgi:hypothetical protein
VLPQGQLHPDLVNRLAGEAAKSARHVLTMCIRAIDYCPPIDLTFGEYLRALITADYDLVQDDDRGYRIAMIEAFRRRGIYPSDLRVLSEESLRWNSPRPPQQKLLEKILPPPESFRELAPDWDLRSDRAEVYKELQVFQSKFHGLLKTGLWNNKEGFELLGLSPDLDGGKFEVHSLRPARRIGPDGEQLAEIVVEITQRQPVYFRNGEAVPEKTWIGGPGKDADMWFRGGCTLLIDPQRALVRYVIVKRIDDISRLHRQVQHSARARGTLRATYFGAVTRLEESEAFAMLHRDQPEEEIDG